MGKEKLFIYIGLEKHHSRSHGGKTHHPQSGRRVNPFEEYTSVVALCLELFSVVKTNPTAPTHNQSLAQFLRKARAKPSNGVY
ncbi:hypothetical protein CFELI_10200 [Corynebacterium felinum]|uniref:Uncharacterized protein n=1 Tax=Corynebacterium felinum TaxID=131318 RepID=A0ABU2BCD5_9CORY|nr:hypothetical protein [Corynebacterium felinum]WJY95638.1 hypothetical protein CFELI_10200 [Corynebacterium felinum]